MLSVNTYSIIIASVNYMATGSPIRKKRYLLLHMGGTIGMVPGKQGALRPPVNVDEYRSSVSSILKRFSKHHPHTTFNFLCLSTCDSNDHTPEGMEELAAVLHASQKDYDGILITHGTDTMATTAAALNLAFQTPGGASNLYTPIVITGAQNTIHTMPSDAVSNLLFGANSLLALSANNYYPGIFVAFGNMLIDGAHVLKVSESAYDAFFPTKRSALLGKADSHEKFGIVFENLFQDQGMSPHEREQKLLDVTGPLPCGHFLISPLNGEEGTPTHAYIHTVDSATFSSPSSYRPQAKDLGCLALLFRLTGIGNTGKRNYSPIRKIVEETGLPVFGALDIPGGKQDMAAYEAGSEAHACGLLQSRATIDAARVQLQWCLAQKQVNLPRLVQIMSTYQSIIESRRGTATHVVGDKDGSPVIASLPDIYLKHSQHPNNGFSYRLNELSQKIVDGYRWYKGNNFRYLSIPPEQANKLGGFLPKPHRNMDETARSRDRMPELTGWKPPLLG